MVLGGAFAVAVAFGRSFRTFAGNGLMDDITCMSMDQDVVLEDKER